MAEQNNGSGMDLGLEDDYGGFFTKLENDKPYTKWAFEGFQGSGKTYTMVMLAIWLHKYIGSKKKIVFVDNEKSAKFFVKDFADAGIGVLHKVTSSMSDVVDIMRMMREGGLADILLIDSVSKIWENFLKAYQSRKRTNKHRLDLADWAPINATWGESFSEPMIHDPYHVLFTGRAGYEYENELDEESGKHESFKSGIKMRAARDTGYEPDALIMMQRHEEVLGKKKTVYRTATVIKDRSRLIDGKTFRNPTPQDFAPAIESSLAAPINRARAIEGDAGQLFASEEDQRAWFRARDILVEEIEALLVETWPGQSADEKQAKIVALKAGFQTASWTWIKTQKPEALAEGKARIEVHIAACKQMKREAIEAEAPKKARGEAKEAAPLKAAGAPPADAPAAPSAPAATSATEAPPAAAAAPQVEPPAEEKPKKPRKQITVLIEGTPEQPPVTPPPPPNIEDVQAG